MSNKPLRAVENSIGEISVNHQKDVQNNDNKLAENIAKTIDDLMKPEQANQNINTAFLQNKKHRKKKRRLHL